MGTPGIGKSIFLGYMAAKLSRTMNIVIQRGNRWWSCKPGAEPIYYGENKPLDLLDDANVVLLADPLGNENGVPIETRSCGCTLIFTSTNRRNFGTIWSQNMDKKQFFMPRWSKDEVIKHWRCVLPAFKCDESVELAYDWLGGSVRKLYELSKQKGPLAKAAQRLIKECLKKVTYEQLLKAAEADPESIDLGESSLSYLLQIEAHDNCEHAVLLFPVSDLMVTVMSAQLEESAKWSRLSFIKAAMKISVLGTLVGRLFQAEVLDGLSGKGQVGRMLKLRQLHELPASEDALAAYVDAEVPVPNTKLEVQVQSADSTKQQLNPDFLYNPLSDTFAAADMFFAIGNTLWLLQVTKRDDHDCKIGALQKLLEGSFLKPSLQKFTEICWVVVVPNRLTASKYAQTQDVKGKWKLKEITVKQYVCSWQD